MKAICAYWQATPPQALAPAKNQGEVKSSMIAREG
jgi:hypothetical protein